jgi:hypothetical protein
MFCTTCVEAMLYPRSENPYPAIDRIIGSQWPELLKKQYK